MMETIQNVNSKSDYLEEKIDIALSDIKEFKHRFVEISEKEHFYDEAVCDLR